jgi:hypothetical protein
VTVELKKPKAFEIVIGLAVFAVTFAAACAFIRRSYPLPDLPNVKAKIEHFVAHPNDYDTLLLGSSRINYQIIPGVFDELNRAAGLPTKTFNAAVAGMRPPEDSFFFDCLLAAKPQRLRWVFMEVMPIRSALNYEQHETLRAQYWHDLPRLWMLWKRATLVGPKTHGLRGYWKDLREPLTDFSEHLGLGVYELANVGRSTFLTERLLNKPSELMAASTYLGADSAGWTVTGRGEGMTPADQARLEKERAERLVTPFQRDTGDPISQEALEAMIARVERLGATPVLIIPPTTTKTIVVPLPERSRKTIVLDFNDVARYPELYQNENRLDRNHLNTAGAKLFTRLVATQWLAELKKRGLAQ